MKGCFIELFFLSLLSSTTKAIAQNPVSDCASLSTGSYILTQNLNSTQGCLVLLESFTSVDLNGFSISGDGDPGDYGISSGSTPTLAMIEIKNGSVTGFDVGINLPLAAGVAVSNLRILRNSNVGIWLGRYCSIRQNTVVDNGTDGARGERNCLVTDNVIGRNGTAGIRVETSAVISGNSLRENLSAGMVVGRGSSITQNISNYNGASGIFVACPSNVAYNTAIDNRGESNIKYNGSGCGNSYNVAP